MDFNLIAAVDLAAWLDAGWWWSIIQTVLGIGLIIFVHELGHFLAAKSCGVKCEKFYVGFDAFDLNLGVFKIPRKLFHFQWGETEYGLGILPLGGYVKMLGQHDNPTEAEAERERAQAEGGQLDPRSYMAKSVIQRMFIISAGVIMNVIFAIVFATIAFYNGVTYDPPVVGQTYAGSPAWKKDLAGARILAFNGTDTEDRYYPFMYLMESVATSGGDADIQLEIQRNGEEGQTEKLSVQPVVGLIKKTNLPMLGVGPNLSCRLLKEDFLVPGAPAEHSDFQGSDVITHINGNPVFSLVDIKSELAKAPDKDAVFTVRRGTPIDVQSGRDQGISEGTDVTVNVSPGWLRTFDGISMQYGEIQEIQEGSPAYQEGILAKDKLLLVDGQPFDPLMLSAEMNLAAREGRKVKLTLRRFEGEKEVQIVKTVTPRVSANTSISVDGLPVAVDELGIAFQVLNRVDRVSEAVSRDLGVLPKDEVVKAQLKFDNEESKKLYESLRGEAVVWDEEFLSQNWGAVAELTTSQPGAYLAVTIRREGKDIPMEWKPVESTKFHLLTRGIRTEQQKETYIASSLLASIGDAGRQVSSDASKIFKILGKLGSGNVPITSLGGIVTIATQAQMEASNGTSRLLLFLTLLSVNLAVLNFLPIPVLDGGHMVFLAWEGVTGRPPNERVQEGLTMVGALLLLSLMLFAFGMDLWRIVSF